MSFASQDVVIATVADKLAAQKKYWEGKQTDPRIDATLAALATRNGFMDIQCEKEGYSSWKEMEELTRVLKLFGYKCEFSMSSNWCNERLYITPDLKWLELLQFYCVAKLYQK